MQAAGPNVFGALVHHRRDPGDLLCGPRHKPQLHPFRCQEREVLGEERVAGLGENTDEVLTGKRVQLHADGKPPLKLGDQVRGFAHVERARGHKQDVIGADHPILGVDRAALNEGQQITLDALARHVRAVHALAPSDLVDLIDEDDAGLLHPAHGFPHHRLHVHQLVGLFLREQLERLGHLEAALLGLLG